ncbi:hypothetical protein FT663_01806 [Candidozyma haemuli var. vulneris]|uniref:WLM domain-containing protein n=1 Tax=Candidozyma haemuli TaxID=45357 RepID=A0A2V1AYF9_9ASCO|nr:hypothetical protein CXQ85_002854 [[Candida] haemuloni]KAF3991072.1 hypothetical protein FT662_01900 [[Candida] haemuloni var. vulneris]KAF3993638.1 hypothetical protein FT663_01806 [[Candida] haemuloni var. vulneris]PVH23127.1 hypothetical protein CXQ85_002854 [[Candida] haemuloni]
MVVEGRAKAKTQPNRKSPVANISNISSLKRFPDKDYALDLLHQMAVAVGPIINHYNFKVGMLCEMSPKSPNLLGLNVNKGQKILIRLRTPYNEKSFFPMSDLIGTFLHELTHNVHGPHDAKFYALLDELRNKYETAFSSGSYVCEENKLGGAYVPPWSSSVTVRQKRLDAVSKMKYKSETRRLGGPLKTQRPTDLKAAMAEAAERRLKDSKWCGGEIDEEALGLAGQDSDTPSEKLKEYKDVIDLTNDESEIKQDKQPEVIVIDACESSTGKSSTPSSPRTLASSVSETTFDVKLPSTQSAISFTTFVPFRRSSSISSSPPSSSSPGKLFIGEDGLYPRLKLVADIDFDHIIEWSEITDTKRSKTKSKKSTSKVSKSTKKSKKASPRKKKKEVRPISFSELLEYQTKVKLGK